MSVAAIAYVKGLKADDKGVVPFSLTSTEKAVLFVLADYYNDERGIAWPSLNRLAAESLLSRRQLIRIMQSLGERGVIKIESAKTSSGDSDSNRYRIPGVEGGSVTMSPRTSKSRGGSDIGGGGVVSPMTPGSVAHDTRTVIEPLQEPLTPFALASEAPTSQKQKAKTSAKDETDPVVLELYKLYPRHAQPAHAYAMIRRQWNIVAQRKGMDAAKASAWLKERVTLYAKKTAGGDNNFLPHPGTWFNGQGFDEDSAEWKPPGRSRGFDEDPDDGGGGDGGPQLVRKSLTPEQFEAERKARREAKQNGSKGQQAAAGLAAQGREPDVRSRGSV